MRPSTAPELISAPSSKTSIIEADCTPRSATNPQPSSKPNSANSKPSERTQPKLCPSNPVSQPRGAVHAVFPRVPRVPHLVSQVSKSASILEESVLRSITGTRSALYNIHGQV